VGFHESAKSVWRDLRGRVLAIALSALIIMAIMLWFEGSSVTRVSGVQTVGVGVYWGQNCSSAVASISWGVLFAGAVKNTIVYVRNEGAQPASLNMSTANWSPSNASNYFKLGWDYSGQILNPNGVLKVTLKLSVSSTVSKLSSVGFSLIIAANAQTLKYGLLVAVTGSGTTNATGTTVYMSGASVAVKAAAASGWTLSNWFLNGSNVGSANPYVLMMIQNCNLTAVFVQPHLQFHLVIGASGKGNMTPVPGTYSYNVGTNVSVSAFPSSGWILNRWLLNGSDVGSTSPHRLTMNSNWNLTALFISPVFAEGFESGNFSRWDGTLQSGGTASVVSVPAKANTLPLLGTHVAEFKFGSTSGGGGAFVYKNVNSSEIYARAYFYVGQGLPLPAANDRFYLIEFNDAATYLGVLGIRKVNGVDRWVLVGKAGTTFAAPTYGSALPSTPQWVCVELHLRVGTNGVLESFINGKLDVHMSGNNSAWGNIRRVMFGIPLKTGPPSAPSDYAMDVYLDQCVIATVYVDP
jgi:hypothetical protein